MADDTLRPKALGEFLKLLRDNGVQQFDGFGIKVAFAPALMVAQPTKPGTVAGAISQPPTLPKVPPAPRGSQQAIEDHYSALERRLGVGTGPAPETAGGLT